MVASTCMPPFNTLCTTGGETGAVTGQPVTATLELILYRKHEQGSRTKSDPRDLYVLIKLHYVETCLSLSSGLGGGSGCTCVCRRRVGRLMKSMIQNQKQTPVFSGRSGRRVPTAAIKEAPPASSERRSSLLRRQQHGPLLLESRFGATEE